MALQDALIVDSRGAELNISGAVPARGRSKST